MNLITVMVGAGVLGFPALFAKTGLVFGSMLLVSCCVTSIYLCSTLAGAIATVERRTGRQMHKMDDVGLACFGAPGQQVARYCVNAIMASKVAIYLVLVGQNMNYIGGFLSYRAWVLMASAVVMGAAFLRDLSVIERFAVIGVVSSVFYFFTIVSGALKAFSSQGQDAESLLLFPGKFESGFEALTVMIFSFGPCDVIATARREMQAPQQLPRALTYSHVLVAIIYFFAGVAGYCGFGGDVQGNVSMSMCDLPGCPGVVKAPGAKWWSGYILSGAVVANLAVTMPILLYCLFTGVESGYPPDDPMPAHLNIAMRVGTVVVCTLVGLTVPFFLQVVGIMSAALVVPLCFFLPIGFFWKATKDAGEQLPPWRMCLNCFLLVMGACCMVIGLSSSVGDLRNEMAKQAKVQEAAAAAAGELVAMASAASDFSAAVAQASGFLGFLQ
jgi:amino acid permease